MNTITISPAAALGGNGYADQNTPLVRNCWYVAARSGEVGRELMHRRLLGVDVAMYRTLAGEPVAVRAFADPGTVDIALRAKERRVVELEHGRPRTLRRECQAL